MLTLFACNDETLSDIYKSIDDKNAENGLDVVKKSIEYELTSADYSTISTAALAKATTAADSALARSVNTTKTLNEFTASGDYIPAIIAKAFPALNKGSNAKISYKYSETRSDKLNSLSKASYVLNANDYKQVWGSDVDYVMALTPTQSPQTKIPAVLAANISGAANGDYKIVQYNYSAAEPEVSVAEVQYLFADFEGMPNGSTAPVTIPGWINKDVTGTRFWQCRIFNGNQYAQFSSNGTNEENIIWLITSQIDLTAGVTPQLSFDVTGGYYKGDLFSVWVSENFNGTEAGIATATWTDITANFDIPTTPEIPASAYGTLRPAGTMNFAQYAGKKVYVAFKYAGNGVGNVATTTYQIDNVKIAETKSTMNVASSVVQYGAYQFDGSAWKEVAASANIVVLQPDDYTAMGVSNLSTTTAPNYLPVLLSQKYPFAQEGNARTVVYRTSSSNYADDYIFTAGQWTFVSGVVDKTEQFVFSNIGWLFDPTVILTLIDRSDVKVQKFIDYIHYEHPDKWYPREAASAGSSTYTENGHHYYSNEDHYYGFNAYYAEIMYDPTRLVNGDAEIKALAGNSDALYAFYDQRLEEALPIFAALTYPTMQSQVSGVDQMLKIRVQHYFSTADRRYFEHTLQCVKSGTSEAAPAEFEYIGREQIPGL
jgi:hypothetical protein